MFCRYFSTTTKLSNKTIPAIAISTSADLINIWSKAPMLMTHHSYIVSKFKAYIDECSLINNNKGSKASNLHTKENDLKAKLSCYLRCINLN